MNHRHAAQGVPRLALPGLIAIAGALVAASQPASAGVALLFESRSLSSEASVSAAGSGESDGPNIATPVGFALDFDDSVNASAAIPQGGASTSATQISRFEPDRWVFQGSTSASASASTATAFAESFSNFFADFTISEPLDITIVASVSGTGEFALLGSDLQPLFEGAGATSFTLQPGAYTVVASATSLLHEPGASGGAYAVQLIGVPGPSTGAVAAIAAGFIARRRRSSVSSREREEHLSSSEAWVIICHEKSYQ